LEAPEPLEIIIPQVDPPPKPARAKKITPRKKQLATKVKNTSPDKGN